MKMKEMKRADVLMTLVSLLLTGALTGSALAQSGRVIQTAAARSEAAQSGNGGFLGTFLSDVSDERARELKLTEVRGAVISQVVKDSPAEKAGLKENDVILSYNNEQVQSAAQVHRLLMETPPGRTVTLGLSRDGKLITVQATLGERQFGAWSNWPGRVRSEDELMIEQAEKWMKEAEELRHQFDSSREKKLLEKAEELVRQAEEFRKLAETHRAEADKLRREGRQYGPFGRGLMPGLRQNYRLGIRTIQLSEQLGRYFNVPEGQGLLVTEVEPGSAAARAGLKAGDCIIEINGQKVQRSADVSRLISEAGERKETTEVGIKIVRDRREQTLKIEPERR